MPAPLSFGQRGAELFDAGVDVGGNHRLLAVFVFDPKDPLGFVSGDTNHSNDDLDAELAKLLDEERGE